MPDKISTIRGLLTFLSLGLLIIALAAPQNVFTLAQNQKGKKPTLKLEVVSSPLLSKVSRLRTLSQAIS
jgi:hypothetical protein